MENTNTWYTLKAVISGTNIKFYVNDVLKIEKNDLPLGGDKIGLKTSLGHTHFDDVKVTTAQKTTYYHYSGNNIVAETDQSNNITARYAYLGGDYKPYSMTRYNEIPGYTAITYYFQYNHRGDVLSMTDQWGTVVAKYTYDPWGNILSVKDGSGNDVSSNPTHRAYVNPIRYAGYRYDQETSLYYLLARYYDPATYRFLTKDPDGGDKDRPLSQNPYAYAEGNPVMKVDPEGEMAALDLEILNLQLAEFVKQSETAPLFN